MLYLILCYASAGNRTRGTCLEGKYVTTTPRMLLFDCFLFILCFINDNIKHVSTVNRTQGYCIIGNKVPTTPQTLLFLYFIIFIFIYIYIYIFYLYFYYQCVVTRNRTWVFSATTKSTNHYTITTNTIISTVCRNCGLNTGPSDLQSDALPTELFRLKFYISCFFIKVRQQQDSNLRVQSTMDQQSISLTTRTYCLLS